MYIYMLQLQPNIAHQLMHFNLQIIHVQTTAAASTVELGYLHPDRDASTSDQVSHRIVGNITRELRKTDE